jgi:hypothetical protein
MSVEWLMALTALVTGLITGIPGLVAAILLSLRNHRQAQRDAVIAEMERVIAWQGKQMQDQQQAINYMVDVQSECREDVIREHERGKSLAAALRKLGQDPGPDPPLPRRSPRHDDPEFVRNTTAHNTTLIRQAEKPPEGKL